MVQSVDVEEQAFGEQRVARNSDRLGVLIVGILTGGISWGLGEAVSGGKDLYSSGLGILVAQVILSSTAFFFGLKRGGFDSLILVAGEFLGLVAFFYATAGLNRGWVSLIALFAIPLLLLPAIAGISGGIAKNVLFERRQTRGTND